MTFKKGIWSTRSDAHRHNFEYRKDHQKNNDYVNRRSASSKVNAQEVNKLHWIQEACGRITRIWIIIIGLAKRKMKNKIQHLRITKNKYQGKQKRLMKSSGHVQYHLTKLVHSLVPFCKKKWCSNINIKVHNNW